MAPEEYVKGATIDARTTVFNLAKLVAWFLSGHELSADLSNVVRRATAASPGDRHRTLIEFQHDWRSAFGQ